MNTQTEGKPTPWDKFVGAVLGFLMAGFILVVVLLALSFSLLYVLVSVQ